MALQSFDNRAKDIEKSNEEYNRLNCIAHNCQSPWSVDAGNGRLCGAHAWADPMDWGRITAHENSKRLIGTSKASFEPVEPFSHEEKVFVLGEFKKALQAMNSDPKSWAKRLRERELNGDILSLHQRKMWRDALGVGHDFA
jgi:hypothetical protein